MAPRSPLPPGLVWIATLGPLLVVVALVVLLYLMAQRVDSRTAMVRHTYEAILTSELILERTIDAETGVRGFLLTGEDRFLAPYEGAEDDVREGLDRLARQTAGNPAQQRRVPGLARAVDEKFVSLRRKIEIRRDAGFAAAIPELEDSRVLMDRIRERVGEIQTEERALLDAYSEDERAQRRLLQLAAVLGTILAGLATGVAGRALVLHARERDRAAREMEQANQQLREQAVEMEMQAEMREAQALELEEQAAELQARTEALAASEARLRRIAESDMVGVLFWGVGGEITYANDAFLEMVGHTREELESGEVNWRAMTPPEWEAVDARAVEQIRTVGVARSFEKEYVRKDGTRVPVLLSAASFAGTEAQGVTLVVDLSERKAAERALGAEARIRSLALEAAQLGTWALDLSSREVLWDRRAREIFGVTGEGPESEEVAVSLIHPEDRDRSLRQVERLVQGEVERYEVEKRILTPAGEIRWAFLNGRLEGGPGCPLRVVGTVMDVTQRKAAEQAIRESEARFRYLAETVPQLVWVTDREGRHEYHNPQWFDYTGLARTDTGQDVWSRVLHPEDGPRALARWRHSLRTGEPYQIEYRFRRHDGEYRWFLVRAVPVLDENGEAARWFGTCTDIHEQKEAQLELARLYHEVQEANRAKSEFLRVMSHELRTPLNAILGYADLLEMGIPEPIGPKARHQVERIRLSAEHQKQLVEDILAFTRIDAGRESVEILPVPLQEVVREVTAVISPLAERQGLTFRVEIHDAPATLLTDPRKLRQILLNLLGNAVKFTDRGDLALRVEQRGPWVGFAVRDTGIGIREADLGHVFDPFWQADSSLTRAREGTGLGLSISRRFAEMLGGEIRVESALGAGSTFTLLLPAAPPLPEEDPPTVRAGAAGEG
jgi:PAS domain S-box-containing protein